MLDCALSCYFDCYFPPVTGCTTTFVITTLTVPNVLVLTGYSTPINTEGGVLPVSIVVSSGSLPPGLGIVGTTIQGVPTVSGTFTFTITATDAFGHVATRTYTMQVIACDRSRFLPCFSNGNNSCTRLRVYKPNYPVDNYALRTKHQVAIVPTITDCQQGPFMPTTTEQVKLEVYPLSTQTMIQSQIKRALAEAGFQPPLFYG
jgi:hypothetical protein